MRVPGTFGIDISASVIAPMTSGMLIRKTHRQPPVPVSTSNPPTNGPTAVNTPASPDQAPIALPRSAPPNKVLTSASEVGTTSAAAAPWPMRATTKINAVGANPQSTDVTPNAAVPAMNTDRLPSKSPSDPPTKTSAPSINR